MPSAWWSQPIRWMVRHKERIGMIALGHSAKELEEFLFDWLLYGAVSFYFTSHYAADAASVLTYVVMTPASAGLCYLYLKFYDWSKKDWLGLEKLKELREGELKGGVISRTIIRISRWGDGPAFIALSIYKDPFVVTAYLRKGSGHYNGLSKRDWRIFWGSVLFSNLYWTLRWTLIFEVLRALYGLVF